MVVLAVLLLAVIPLLSWRSSTRKFVAKLDIPGLHVRLAQLTGILQDAIAAEWLPSLRRRVLAEASTEVAAGLEETTRALTTAVNSQLADATAIAPNGSPAAMDGLDVVMQPLRPELLLVLRGDMLGLIRASIEPAWAAIETGQRAPAGAYAQRVRSLAANYSDNLAAAGLMMLPTTTIDPGPREQYVARTWSGSVGALDALRVDGEDDMVQLCRSQQLNFLSTGNGSSPVLRFAPRPVRPVLEADGSPSVPGPGIVWTTSGELAGAVRLVHLKPGTVGTTLGGAQ
jgi:hypothetical protein